MLAYCDIEDCSRGQEIICPSSCTVLCNTEVYPYSSNSKGSHALQESHLMDNGTDTEEAQKQRVARKRIAIAAEALTNASDVKIPNIPKTEAVLRVLGEHLNVTQIQCTH